MPPTNDFIRTMPKLCARESRNKKDNKNTATFMTLTIANKTGDASSLFGETSRQLAPQI
jgi:hypothetical protein